MIDTEEYESPGWWLARASTELTRRRRRLFDLQERIAGRGPLPHGAEGLEEAYRAFQKKARTNWAERIIEAAAERIRLHGFATAVDSDGDGDEEATRQARAAQMFREVPQSIDDMLGLSVGYLMVGRDDRGRVSVTSESPFNTITFHDPLTDDVRVGAKIFADTDMGWARAYLIEQTAESGVWRWVAKREIRRSSQPTPKFSGASWDWDEEMGGAEGQRLEVSSVPAFRLLNHRGVGDFELHTDLLDRITHQTLQRLVIVAMQAYRQRALQNAPQEDEDGIAIDYSKLHAGPGTLWGLPEGTTVWESNQVSLDGVLGASKDDRRELAAVTGTPLPVLMPEGANQSAEGAAFSKESVIFRCEKRIELATPELARCYATVAELNGDRARAQVDRITPMFADPARRSLAEMADAATKAKDDLPLEERLIKIWGYSPDRAKQLAGAVRAERLELAAYQGIGA